MDSKTGLLLNPSNIKLHRQYFNEMVRLLGITVLYLAPREDKHYNGYGELDSFYYEPVETGCIYDEHPTQKTMKKLGWDAELDTESSIIHVAYDLKNLQVGAIFSVPSGLDGATHRKFRVNKMSTTFVYPASIACEIAPLYESTFEESSLTHVDNNFSLLAEEE